MFTFLIMLKVLRGVKAFRQNSLQKKHNSLCQNTYADIGIFYDDVIKIFDARKTKRLILSFLVKSLYS